MALKAVLLLTSAAALLAFIAPAAASNVPVRFCVVDCEANGSGPRVGVDVQLSGCIDEPAVCKTGLDGCCTIDSSYGGRKSINYCNGAAGNLCNWNILNDAHGPYVAEPQAFIRNGAEITPKAFICCWCNGQDYCNPVVYADAERKECTALKSPGTTDSASGPFTVTFRAHSCYSPEDPVSGCAEAKRK